MEKISLIHNAAEKSPGTVTPKGGCLRPQKGRCTERAAVPAESPDSAQTSLQLVYAVYRNCPTYCIIRMDLQESYQFHPSQHLVSNTPLHTPRNASETSSSQ